ncbi:MAG: FKBP-type peptidyl-prolyl cis-trans isomerase [Planctomycetota bacterium]|nr:FKBP-type peptidyl-prolyl cis-trans isomerase [Planctomycetota bacterium]
MALIGTALWAQDGATTNPAPGTQPATAPAEKLVTPSGLTILKVAPGENEISARAGDQVFVHYVGRMDDGKEFDSSRSHAETAQNGIDFTLGQGHVIKGWDEGIAGMRIGEKRQLIVPSELGYGKRGMGGVIPPDARLTFDVELVGLLRRPPAPPAPPAE